MNCPLCNKDEGFSLRDASDDYHDGYVQCDNCGKDIAIFSLIVDDENGE